MEEDSKSSCTEQKGLEPKEEVVHASDCLVSDSSGNLKIDVLKLARLLK